MMTAYFDNQSNEKSTHPDRNIAEYLSKRVPEFRELSELRQKGWSNPQGDKFFQKQRQNADQADEHTAQIFYQIMERIASEIHQSTGAFLIRRTYQPTILDMCFAPGGFLGSALALNPTASALGFSLPVSNGGHKVLLPPNQHANLKFMDVTMLAADMGKTDIPAEHPDAENFLPRQLEHGQAFDMVLCDGQALRTHQRASYRKDKECSRLTISQLALGLEHVRTGGTMIILLHKVDAWRTVKILYTFHQFSSVQVFKPRTSHTKRSSFYLIATRIQTQHPEAVRAIQRWKRIWEAATFGTDEAYLRAVDEGEPDVGVLLEQYGPELVKLGRRVWDIQARALKKASFIRVRK